MVTASWWWFPGTPALPAVILAAHSWAEKQIQTPSIGSQKRLKSLSAGFELFALLLSRYQHGTKADALYEPSKPLETRAKLDLGASGQHEVGYYHLHRDGVDWVFVDHPCYQRAGDGAQCHPVADWCCNRTTSSRQMILTSPALHRCKAHSSNMSTNQIFRYCSILKWLCFQQATLMLMNMEPLVTINFDMLFSVWQPVRLHFSCTLEASGERQVPQPEQLCLTYFKVAENHEQDLLKGCCECSLMIVHSLAQGLARYDTYTHVGRTVL